jgi:ParB/RepB/Spo0J family partition protein
MATRLNNTAIDDTPGVVKTVPLTDILADQAKNSRKFMPDPKYIANLSRDLIVRGQLIPMLVMERNGAANEESPAPYELIDGFCRYSALEMAKEQGNDMPALIRVMPDMDAARAYLMSVAANNPALRKEPSFMDLAYQITEMKAQGMQGKEVAGELGRSPTWVSQTAKLVTLRPDVQKRIHAGEIPWAVARVLPDLTEGEQDKMLAKLEKAKEIGQTQTAIANEAHEAREGKSAGEKRGKKKGKRSGGEVTTISAKKAMNVFEGLSAPPVVDPETGKEPKETKAEETRRLIFGIMWKFIAGKLGQQAMVNQIGKLL